MLFIHLVTIEIDTLVPSMRKHINPLLIECDDEKFYQVGGAKNNFVPSADAQLRVPGRGFRLTNAWGFSTPEAEPNKAGKFYPWHEK